MSGRTQGERKLKSPAVKLIVNPREAASTRQSRAFHEVSTPQIWRRSAIAGVLWLRGVRIHRLEAAGWGAAHRSRRAAQEIELGGRRILPTRRDREQATANHARLERQPTTAHRAEDTGGRRNRRPHEPAGSRGVSEFSNGHRP